MEDNIFNSELTHPAAHTDWVRIYYAAVALHHGCVCVCVCSVITDIRCSFVVALPLLLRSSK